VALVATSANFAGGETPATREQLDPTFIEKVDGVMEGESGAKGASTVAEVISESVMVHRQGVVSFE
jgi:tRNA A37 threonylcarbamoyladenosine synthetase subunit TsaC/SUA5/YrdC